MAYGPWNRDRLTWMTRLQRDARFTTKPSHDCGARAETAARTVGGVVVPRTRALLCARQRLGTGQKLDQKLARTLSSATPASLASALTPSAMPFMPQSSMAQLLGTPAALATSWT